MIKKPNQFTRRKFLLHLSALTPVVAAVAFKGNLFSGLTLAQGAAAPTAIPTMDATTLDCVASPSMTEGPYFVDELLKRVDIRTDPTDNSVKPGIPLNLQIGVFSVNGAACAPLQNAQVDIWHCDALGLYSDEAANNTQGKRFLRGYQVTDGSGLVNFTTIYPGWYMGRTVHIHVKVRTFSTDGTPGAATPQAGTQSYAFNSQLFFDDTLSDTLYTQTPYNTRGQRETRNANDMVFNGTDAGTADPHDIGEKMLIVLTKDGNGYTSNVNIGVDLSQPSATSFGGGGPGGSGAPGGPGGQPPQPPAQSN